MWICGPLRGAPPLSSPLHPFSWQRPQTTFSHAFPKSRYVDSIRLTSHNGEFVQQEEPHYLNPSVALSLSCFEIDGRDWRVLPSVSLRDGQKVNSWAPSVVHEHWLCSADAKSTLALQKLSAPSTTSQTPSLDIWISFTEKRTSKASWIIFIEWPKSDVDWLSHIYLPRSL